MDDLSTNIDNWRRNFHQQNAEDGRKFQIQVSKMLFTMVI